MTPTNSHIADHWRLRSRSLAFGKLPLLMGIVNVTPDSFSDGGRFADPDAAVEHGLRLAAEGADILDVGGESTRPGAEPVDLQEELRRVTPVLGALARKTTVPISIDTSKALVARHAFHAGAEILNDVSALTDDPAMLAVAAETGCGICIMHKQGQPKTMQENPAYRNVVAEVLEYLQSRRDALVNAGIPLDRIAVDPGIGFGKTTAHNVQLLNEARQFHALRCPVLIGHSRKRFLADSPSLAHAPTLPTTFPHQPPSPAAERIGGTIGVALALARQGIQILRVHDVAAVRQALLWFQATGGLSNPTSPL